MNTDLVIWQSDLVVKNMQNEFECNWHITKKAIKNFLKPIQSINLKTLNLIKINLIG